MKHLYLLFLGVIFSVTFTSCNKSLKDAAIIRDCTGTYARMNDADFLISNPSSVEKFDDQEKVRILFEKAQNNQVDGSPGICYMYHEYDGVIRIIDVK